MLLHLPANGLGQHCLYKTTAVYVNYTMVSNGLSAKMEAPFEPEET